MASFLFNLQQQRLIDNMGVASGGALYFYLSGTLTLATIYSDAGLTTPLINPVVVNAAAAIPEIFLDQSIAYRCKVVYPNGWVDDTDPVDGELQQKAAILQTDDLPIGADLLEIVMPTRNLAMFSTGGSFGVGDFGTMPVNIHAGDDGTDTRVVACLAETAPLFLGYTLRPNGESGGDAGRTIAAFEGYRLSNVTDQQEVGGVRVVSEGTTSGQYGGQLQFLTKSNGQTSFIPRTIMTMDGFWGFGATGAGTNRLSRDTGSTVLTVSATTTTSGDAGFIELCGAQRDIACLEGNISAVHNFNSGGTKQVASIDLSSIGTTAGNRGGEIQLSTKADGGALALQATVTNSGLRLETGFGCNGTNPQGKVTLPANATDLATAITLLNAIKALLIANGQGA